MGKMRQLSKYLKQGDIALERGDLNGAEDAFRQVLELDSRSLEGMYGLGSVFSYRGDWQEVVQWSNKILKLDESHFGAWALRGNALLAEQRYTEAKDALLKVQPDAPPPIVLGQVGMCYEGLGNLEEAEQFFRRALENDISYISRFDSFGQYNYVPMFADMHHLLGRVLQKQGNIQEAKLHYHLAKRNDATIELDSMCFEIMTAAELDNHPYFDMPQQAPDDMRERLIWLASQDDSTTVTEALTDIDPEEAIPMVVGMIDAAQRTGHYYVSTRLRILGDALNDELDSDLFSAVQSYPWRLFFELVERVEQGEINEEEALQQLTDIDLPPDTIPLVFILLRRFIEFHAESALPLAHWLSRLLQERAAPEQALAGQIIWARALVRARRADQAHHILNAARNKAEALQSDTLLLDVLDAQYMQYVHANECEEALACVNEIIMIAEGVEGNPRVLFYRLRRAQLLVEMQRLESADADCRWLFKHAEEPDRLGAPGEFSSLLVLVAEGLGRKLSEDEQRYVAKRDEKETAANLFHQAQEAFDGGEMEHALELLQEAETLSWQEGNRAGVVHILHMKASIIIQNDRLAEAADILRSAIDIAEGVADRVDLWPLLMAAADVAEQLQEPEEAEALFQRALQEARIRRDRGKEEKTLQALSDLLFDSNPQRAIDLFGETLVKGNSTAELPALWREADEAGRRSDWQAAVDAYEQLLLLDDEQSRKLRPLAIANRGMALYQQGHLAAAVLDFQTAADFFQELGNTTKAVDLLGRMAQVKQQLGESAESALNQAKLLASLEPSPGLRRSAFTQLGEQAFEAGFFEMAESVLEKALDLSVSEDWRDRRDELSSRHTLGKIHRRKGEYQQAMEQYQQALACAEALCDADADAEIRGNRAIALRYLGRLGEAVEDYESMIAYLERQGHSDDVAEVRVNLASSQFLLGHHSQAVENTLDALASFDKKADVAMAERALVMLGQYADTEELPERVQARLRTLVEQGSTSTEALVRDWTRSKKAEGLILSGNYSLGRQILEEIADSLKEQKDVYNQGRTLLGLGRLLLGSDTGAAEVYGRKARKIAVSLDQAPLLAECDQLLLHVSVLIGDWQVFDKRLSRLLDDWRRQRLLLDEDLDRVLLADQAASFLDGMAAQLLDQGRAGLSLEVQDLGRGQALVDLVQQTEKRPGCSLAHMQVLLNELPGPATLLTLTWIDHELTAFVFTRDHTAPVVRPTGIDRQELAAIKEDYEHEILRYRAAGSLSWEAKAAPLIAALDGCLRKGDFLIMVIEEELQALPLHALKLSSGERLLERVAVVYGPSMQLMDLLRQRPGHDGDDSRGHGLVAAGVTFLDEPMSILQRFGGMGFTAARLNKNDLAEAFADARFIHIACHGSFDPQNHLESGLVIADTSEPLARDVLSVRELMGWQMRADLAVLSACETGRGHASSSEFLGLGRAFLAAGAKAVITALWKVENRATQELMLDFYHHLFNGQERNVAQALRLAQLQAAEKGNFCDWAAFKLTGWPIKLPGKYHSKED